MSEKSLSLRNLRVIVPPARPGLNPLLKVLQMKGAAAIEWPAIRAAEPQDCSAMDKAIREISRYDWILFSGGNSASNFLARLKTQGLNPKLALPRNLAAVGHSAFNTMKKAGIEVYVYPRRHVAEAVAAAIDDKERISGKRCLLVRVAGASDSLVQALQARGASVEQLEGYRLLIETDGAAVAWNPQPDLIAFASPTAVRLFVEAMSMTDCVAATSVPPGVEVACVGPATEAEAGRLGLKVDLTSGGSHADLLADLVSRFGILE